MIAPTPDRRSLWATYRRFYEGRRLLVWLAVGGAFLRSVLVIPISLLARDAIDRGITSGSSGRLWAVGGALAGLYLLTASLTLAVHRLSARVTVEATARLREQLLRRLYLLPRAELTGQEPATIHAVVVEDTERVSVLSRSVISTLLPGAVTVVALVVYLLVMNPLLGVVVCAVAPMTALVNRALREGVERHERDYRADRWRYSVSVSRALRLWDLTTSQAAERDELAHVDGQIRSTADSAIRLERAHSIYQSVQNMTVGLSAVIVLLVGGLAVQRGAMTLGTFLSFFVVMALAMSAGRAVLGALPIALTGREALSSITDWMDHVARPVYRGSVVADLDGSFCFEGVSFAYDDSPVLSDLDLDVPAGTTVAIAGPNGAGKTTLVNLLIGWYAPQEGRVLGSGVAFTDLDMQTWRRHLALVHQDPPFFSATVRDNITYGLDGVTDEDIAHAASLATADLVLAQLPGGLDTPMGEDGVLLSGGQRQRIALTRALLRRPRLLILDEPTNHVDRPSVRRLLDGLRRLPQAPTVVLITHDPEVLAMAEVVHELVPAARPELADDPLDGTVAVGPSAP